MFFATEVLFLSTLFNYVVCQDYFGMCAFMYTIISLEAASIRPVTDLKTC